MFDLKKYSNNKWYIEHFDGYPAFTEMTAAGFTKRLYGSRIPVNSINAAYYENKQGDWLTLIDDQQAVGKAIVQQYIMDKSVINNLYNNWLSKFAIMMDFFYKAYPDNLGNYDEKELWLWAEKIYHLYREEVSMPGSFIDGFMFYADKRLDYLVREFCEKNKIKNYPAIYSALAAPIEPSFINEEENELKKICKLLVKNKYSPEVALKKFLSNVKNKDLSQFVVSHLFKYSWVKSSYSGYKEYSFKDLENEIDNVIGSDMKSDNAKIHEKHKFEKQNLINKYNFNDEIIAISKITEIFVKWQDLRKIYTLTFATFQEKILQEISKRSKIELELLRYCRIVDLKKALGGKLKENELKKRQQSSLFIHFDGEIKYIFTGRKAKEFIKKISEVKIGNIKEIKGLTASMGKARGTVKIVRSIDELGKVKAGDVLVAAMTRPEHLTGMKRAVAIVTDDGGITSHAAIVARELKKPCIIGTKIATKVLKDGDLVEVDANKGVVKILG